MRRRKFLTGASGVAMGGSALVGTGAFSRVESERHLSVAVAQDTDAYLGLDGCPGSPNNSYTETDGEGHLTVQMEPGNPTDAGGQGINSDSLSAFDDVFQICNQGKQQVCVWIDAEVAEGLLDAHDTSQPVIDFYVLDGNGDPVSILDVEQAVSLPVGECLCVGIRTFSRYLEEDDELVKDNEVVINADATLDDCREVNGGEVPPGEEPGDGKAISWVAFCQGGVTADDVSLDVTDFDEDGDPLEVDWSSSTDITTSVVFGGARLFNRSGGGGGTIVLDGDEVQWKTADTQQRPPSPCPNGECGPKFDWTGSEFVAVNHQDQCNGD